MKLFQYHTAVNPQQAQEIYQKNAESQFIAGGTNLLDLMKKDIVAPSNLIDINRLSLNKIEPNEKGVNIGALVINSEVSDNPYILSNFPLLAKAITAGASQQLRNMATVGGNIMQRTRCPYFYDKTLPCNKREPNSGCGAKEGLNRTAAIFGASENCVAVHPSDMCVALAALDATMIVRKKDGASRDILFKDFHRLPENNPERDNTLQEGELITNVIIANNQYVKNNYYLKIRDRASYAFALVAVAAALELEGDRIVSARLALGGVAHKPWRLYEVEDFLKGKKANDTTFIEAGNLAVNGAKPLKHNSFKIELLKKGVREALNKCI